MRPIFYVFKNKEGRINPQRFDPPSADQQGVISINCMRPSAISVQ